MRLTEEYRAERARRMYIYSVADVNPTHLLLRIKIRNAIYFLRHAIGAVYAFHRYKIVETTKPEDRFRQYAIRRT